MRRHLGGVSKHLVQARKAASALGSGLERRALRLGVAASGVHQPLLSRLQPQTVIDVGANRGQFALDVAKALPDTRVYSFEPMPEAAAVYRRVFAGSGTHEVIPTALGSTTGKAVLHVSSDDDSSSLLPIGERQSELFPGTEEQATVEVDVTTLDGALAGKALARPLMLKLDVQGFELEVLRGAVATLHATDWVYVECSFEELYDGQALASDVERWLVDHGFGLAGIGAVTKARGHVVQADLLFSRRPSDP